MAINGYPTHLDSRQRVVSMSETKPHEIRSTAWFANLLAQVLPFLTFLLVTPLLVTKLGGEAYGRLVILSLFPQILAQFDLGIATSSVRTMARVLDLRQRGVAQLVVRRILGASVTVGLLLAIVLFSMRTIIASLLGIDSATHEQPSQHDLEFACAALWVLTSFIGLPFSASLRSAGELRFLAVLQSFAGILYWAFALVIVGLGGLVWHVMASGVALAVAVGAAQVLALRNMFQAIPDDGRGAGENLPTVLGPRAALLDFGAFFAQLTSLITYHADKMLIAAFVSPAAAGAYSICSNIAGKLLMFAGAVSAYSFPQAARYHAANARPLLRDLQDSGTRIVVAASLFFTVPAVALAEPFLRIWIGQSFAEQYAIALRLLLIGYLCATFSTVASNVANAIGRSDICAKFAALGGVMTLVACYVLVREFGVLGAAMAALIGMSQAVWFSQIVSRVVGDLPARRWFFHGRLLIVALCAGLPIYAVSLSVSSWGALLAAGAVGVLLGIGLWIVFGFASREQLDLLSSAAKRISHSLRK